MKRFKELLFVSLGTKIMLFYSTMQHKVAYITYYFAVPRRISDEYQQLIDKKKGVNLGF